MCYHNFQLAVRLTLEGAHTSSSELCLNRVASLLEFGTARLTVVNPVPNPREEEWDPAKEKGQGGEGNQPDEA